MPLTNPLYYYGLRICQEIHSRLRIGCSNLRAHLFHNIHVIDNPFCNCENGYEETPYHFIFECTKYTTQRETLRTNLLPTILDNLPTNYILFGIPNADPTININIFSPHSTFTYFKPNVLTYKQHSPPTHTYIYLI